MNFLRRIEELKKESSKVKFRDLPKWAIALPLFLILQIPTIIRNMSEMLTATNHTDFIFQICFFGFFSSGFAASMVAVYKSLKDLKQDKIKVSDKDVNDFILSFPEEYREIVIKNMSKFPGKKKYLSLRDLNKLEKLLILANLKEDIVNNKIANTLNNEKHNVIAINDLNLKVKEKNELY